MNISIKKNTPAPGQYGRGIEINPLGLYCVSTISNSKAAAFSPSKHRFQPERPSVTPGPGVYNPSDYTNGHYLTSNFKNRGSPSYTKPHYHIRRQSTINKVRDTPGPGTYMPPSDFGYLELYKYSPRTS